MGKNTKREKITIVEKKIIKPDNYSSDGKKSIWCYDKLDRSGKFAFDLDRDDFNYREFLSKMINYSNMTWSEIKKQTHDNGKSKHHYLNIEGFSKDALDRFNIKNFEEYSENIFSFAFQNKLRIIGIRIDEYFHVVWYDPEHDFYPSTKK